MQPGAQILGQMKGPVGLSQDGLQLGYAPQLVYSSCSTVLQSPIKNKKLKF
jgi:hypothetical protein